MNANRAVVTKTKRALFERTYPTLLALQDGATIEINYPQPKLLLKYDNLFRENPNTGHPIIGFLLIMDFSLVFRCPVLSSYAPLCAVLPIVGTFHYNSRNLSFYPSVS